MPVKKIFLVPEEDWTEIKKKNSNVEDMNHVIIPVAEKKQDKLQDEHKTEENDKFEKGKGEGKGAVPPPPSSFSSVQEKNESDNSTKSLQEITKENNDKNLSTEGTWRPPGKLVSGMEVRLKNPWKRNKKSGEKSKGKKKSKLEWISI